MNRSWIALLYGYLVCIIAVIVAIVSVSGLVDAVFDRANPLGSREGAFGPRGGSLTSFEAYRATQDRMPPRTRTAADTARDTLTTAELRAEYEAVRADRLERVRFDATKRMVKHFLLLLLSVALFMWHWRWLRIQREPVSV